MDEALSPTRLFSELVRRALAVCAALAATACSGSFGEMRAPFHTSLSTAHAPIVTIANVVGEVRVKPGDGNVVDVSATKYASSQAALADIDIVARPVAGGVSVTTIYRDDHTGGVRYDVTVPRDASVRITNTTGTINVGPIGGSLFARTATGTIEASLGTLTANRSVDLKSTTGTIALHVAGDSSATVSASSALGSITSAFPSIETVRSNLVGANAGGRIGGGASPVHLAVGTGSISIERE